MAATASKREELQQLATVSEDTGTVRSQLGDYEVGDLGNVCVCACEYESVYVCVSGCECVCECVCVCVVVALTLHIIPHTTHSTAHHTF